MLADVHSEVSFVHCCVFAVRTGKERFGRLQRGSLLHHLMDICVHISRHGWLAARLAGRLGRHARAATTCRWKLPVSAQFHFHFNFSRFTFAWAGRHRQPRASSVASGSLGHTRISRMRRPWYSPRYLSACYQYGMAVVDAAVRDALL